MSDDDDAKGTTSINYAVLGSSFGNITGRQASKLGEREREREREREEKLRNKNSRNFTQIERSKNYAYTFPTRLGLVWRSKKNQSILKKLCNQRPWLPA
jgi:hypothetical protein